MCDDDRHGAQGTGTHYLAQHGQFLHQPDGRKVAEKQLLGLLVGVGGFNKKGLELAGPHQGPYGLPLVA